MRLLLLIKLLVLFNAILLEGAKVKKAAADDDDDENTEVELVIADDEEPNDDDAKPNDDDAEPNDDDELEDVPASTPAKHAPKPDEHSAKPVAKPEAHGKDTDHAVHTDPHATHSDPHATHSDPHATPTHSDTHTTTPHADVQKLPTQAKPHGPVTGNVQTHTVRSIDNGIEISTTVRGNNRIEKVASINQHIKSLLNLRERIQNGVTPASKEHTLDSGENLTTIQTVLEGGSIPKTEAIIAQHVVRLAELRNRIATGKIIPGQVIRTPLGTPNSGGRNRRGPLYSTRRQNYLHRPGFRRPLAIPRSRFSGQRLGGGRFGRRRAYIPI